MVNTLGGGFVARALRYPIVTEGVGSFSWGTAAQWAASPDGVSWTPAGPEVVPATADFVRSGNGTDIAFGPVADPTDDPATGGPRGGFGLWVRSAGGEWEDLGLLAFGPGGETIDDAVTVPAGFVAVGTAQVRRADGTTASSPLALASADGRTWAAEVVPAPSEQTSLPEVCALPDGGALASGIAVIDGVRRLFLARRDVAGVWTAVDTASIPTDVIEFSDCALFGDRTVLTANLNGLPQSFTTTDGLTFESTTVDVPGVIEASINALVVDGTRLFGAGGVAGEAGNVDVALWVTSDGQTWERITVTGFEDPDSQTGTEATIANGVLVVSGFDRGAPVTWTLPVPA